MNKSSPKEWILPAGTLVKIDGLPYSLCQETKVSGFGDPIAALDRARTRALRLASSRDDQAKEN